METHIEENHNNMRNTEKDLIVESSTVLYQCEECEYKCEKEVTLNKHTNTEHPQLCSRKPNSDVNVDNAKDKFYCDECNYSCKAKQSLRKHKKKNHNVKNVKECEKSFSIKTIYVSTTSIEVSYQSRIVKIAFLKKFVTAYYTGGLPKEKI